MKYIKISCLVALLFMAGGCKKALDVNSDPASPQTAKAEFYLAPIIAQMATCSVNDYSVAQFQFTQMIGAQEALNTWERHGYVEGDGGTLLWRFAYINAGLNLEDMIKKAEEVQNYTLVGIGYAIKAWGFQQITDQHGPVVLEEAFMPNKLSFKFDDQATTYAKVREWCFIALANLNKTDGADFTQKFVSFDYINGKTAVAGLVEYKKRWRKFIYALLATQYSHLINKPDFKAKYADSVIKYVDLSYISSSEDTMISFDNSNDSNTSPLSVTGGWWGNLTGRVGQPIVNYLTGGVRGTPTPNPKASLDPRLTRMINPMVTTSTTTNGVYRGVVATVGDIPTTKTIPSVYGNAVNSAANPSPGKYLFGIGNTTTDNPKVPLFTYAQLQFAKAEALLIKENIGGAYNAYINGITGHMDFVNLYGLNGRIKAPAIAASEITAYLTSSEVAQNASELTIADIMGQKYIAQWGWAGMEAWTDMRKYRYNPNVFRQFKQLENAQFVLQVSNGGNITGIDRYAYRQRYRYNSEVIWNRPELEKFGATSILYTFNPMWFGDPTN